MGWHVKMACLADRVGLQLISSSNVHAISTLSYPIWTTWGPDERAVHCCFEKVGRARIKGARRPDSRVRLEETLKMDDNMQSTDRVLSTIY